MSASLSPRLVARYRRASGAIALAVAAIGSPIAIVRLLGLYWLLLNQVPPPAAGTDAGR